MTSFTLKVVPKVVEGEVEPYEMGKFKSMYQAAQIGTNFKTLLGSMFEVYIAETYKIPERGFDVELKQYEIDGTERKIS